MKPAFLLLALITLIAFSSCTTAYKTGQTPDDVYYSPARPEDEYVVSEKKQRYESVDDYYDDRYLRMKVRNRYRWSDLDEWYYYGNRYSNVYYHNYWNPWTPYTYWNCTYNPYYYHSVVLINPTKTQSYNRPRYFNLNTYNSNSLTNNNYSNPKVRNTGGGTRVFSPSSNNSSRTNSNTGNELRNIFRSNSSSSSSSSTNTKSNSSSSPGTNSSSSSGSSSGGSGGTAPVRKF